MLYRFSNKKNINSIILYALIFFTIIFSRDTLFTTVKFGFTNTFLSYVVIIVFSYIYLIVRYRKNIYISRKPVIVVLVFIGILIITSIIKLDFQIYIMSIVFYILTATLFIHICTFEEFYTKYSNIITALAVYSIITCYIVKPIILNSGITYSDVGIITNTANLSFFDLGFSFVVTKSYYLRNFGIFREPGIYQFFLLIALFYELLFRKSGYRYFNAIVISLTVLTTFSPPGILVMLIVVLLHIIKLIRDRKINKKHIIAIVVIIVCSSIIFLFLYSNVNSFYDIVTQSIKKLFTYNDSSSTRIQSLIWNIKLFLHSPIWGNKFHVVQNGPVHNTNTTFSILAMFGIFACIIKLKLFYNLSKKVDERLDMIIVVFISFMILVNTQFLLGNAMFWILMFSSYMIESDSEYYIKCDLEK